MHVPTFFFFKRVANTYLYYMINSMIRKNVMHQMRSLRIIMKRHKKKDTRSRIATSQNYCTFNSNFIQSANTKDILAKVFGIDYDDFATWLFYCK